jgi:ATP-dependent DNA helicase RecQ
MTDADTDLLPALRDIIARHWGFHELRPHQEQAMRAVLDGRDSLVVLPTGGGKSLCYQAPAVLCGGTTVVISPLIALMKDQVDGLRTNGVAAAQLDSSLSHGERSVTEMELRGGRLSLLFISPERLVQTDLYRLLQQIGVRTFAIDEAHCISHWGHDFRPEYRQLARLRDFFPNAAVHAYTATATEQVRRDIIAQLALQQPEVLVGNFDRPNLTYRVLPRHNLLRQVTEVLERHAGEGGIIYCPTRREVDDLGAALKQQGINVLPYHAGMTAEQRHEAQEAFMAERCDVIVATVAFGMGIDRSNVRFVLHTGLPKSLEHYQQESGRAGRDGLEAECVLLYSGGDVVTWKARIQNPRDQEQPPDPQYVASALKHLDDMDRYARGAVCRHRALVQYFGQGYEAASCNACDLCLGDTQEVPDATVIAQKVLSCVARVKEGFGIGHVIDVLRGQNNLKVQQRDHDKLSTFGILKDHSAADLRDWVYQLIGQKVLEQAGAEYPKLRLNDASWEVMRGQRQVRLVQMVRRKKGERPQRSCAAEVSWAGVDAGLFDILKGLRRELAAERQVPAYVIFPDNTLRELAQVRPSTLDQMRLVYGVGDAKLRDFGQRFVAAILVYCRRNSLATDQPRPAASPEQARAAQEPHMPVTAAAAFRRETAYTLFRAGAAVDDVAGRVGLKRGTVLDYLADFIRLERPASLAPWVEKPVYDRVAAAARQVVTDRLKPIYLALGEEVGYDVIRLVVAHLQARGDCPPTTE